MAHIYPSKLQERTLELYAALPRNVRLKQISSDTGLTKSWLSEFFNGNLKYPQIGKVEILYEYLSGSPLKV